MDDQIDFTVALLRVVAKDLQSFTDEQKAEILAGNAKLKLIAEFKGAKKVDRGSEPVVDADALREQLEACKSRDEARVILKGLNIPKSALQKLTRQLDLPVQRDDGTDRLIDRIVESVVGFRLRSLAIQGKGESVSNIPEVDGPVADEK